MSTGSEGAHRAQGGDLLVRNIGRLLTLGGYRRPRRGGELRDLGVQSGAAVLIEGGVVSAVGPEPEIRREGRSVDVVDAEGRLALPGFVDAHTHVAFVGSREGELAEKLAGKTYGEIVREGGGILRTVRETREATQGEITRETAPRLLRMVVHGTTTTEAKSGYGLALEHELKLLASLDELRNRVPMTLVPTFMGAHAVPPEYATDREGYVDALVKTMVPEVASQGVARYCDAFVDEGFFSADQGRRILTAGQEAGLSAKVHADEFTASGGAELAAAAQAVSADHLLHASDDGLRAMARSGTVAVLLPGTSFGSMDLPYADARRVIDAGVAVALGTDLSPNAWIESMSFILSLASYRLRMHPEEAIAAATWNAAWAVGMAGEVGSLEAGKRGDLLLLEAREPAEIPYHIAGNLVGTVVKDGVVVAQDGHLTSEAVPG